MMDAAAPYAVYHEDGDILYVRVRDAPIARSQELDLWRHVDYAADGRVVAVEFVNVGDGLRLDDVPERHMVERLIVEAFGAYPVVRVVLSDERLITRIRESLAIADRRENRVSE